MRFALVCLLLLLAGPAPAQQGSDPPRQSKGEVFQPPRGESARDYRRNVGRRVSTDARYLSADAPLDLSRSTLREGMLVDRGERSGGRGDLGSALGWIVIALILGALGFALFQARYGDMFAGTGSERKREPRTVELADMGTADVSGLTPDALARMDDPREALRLLLIHALARAADGNDIALRRSFTARDVLARVPGDWRLRGLLEAIVRRGELVLFGGRAFTREDLATVLQAAQPMFGRGRR